MRLISVFCGASEMLAVVVLPEVIATLVSGAGAKPSGAVSSRMVYVPAGSNGLLAVFPSGPVVSWATRDPSWLYTPNTAPSSE